MIAKRLAVLAMILALPAPAALAASPLSADTSEAAFSDAPISDNELNQSRGMYGPTVITSSQSASSSGNSTTGGTTGNNTATDGAFSGVSGIATLVQNTGNNVVIQSSTVLNVNMYDGSAPTQ